MHRGFPILAPPLLHLESFIGANGGWNATEFGVTHQHTGEPQGRVDVSLEGVVWTRALEVGREFLWFSGARCQFPNWGWGLTYWDLRTYMCWSCLQTWPSISGLSISVWPQTSIWHTHAFTVSFPSPQLNHTTNKTRSLLKCGALGSHGPFFFAMIPCTSLHKSSTLGQRTTSQNIPERPVTPWKQPLSSKKWSTHTCIYMLYIYII